MGRYLNDGTRWAPVSRGGGGGYNLLPVKLYSWRARRGRQGGKGGLLYREEGLQFCRTNEGICEHYYIVSYVLVFRARMNRKERCGQHPPISPNIPVRQEEKEKKTPG